MKFALITGASKGIGKAIASELALRGHHLILVARNQDLLDQTAVALRDVYKITVHVLSMDLSHPDAAQNIYNWCKLNQYEINILVNNAGYGISGLFEHKAVEDYVNMMQVNMVSLVQLTSLFLPQLKQQKKAYILNIGSSAAYQAVPYLAVYAATKSFVVSFSRALQYELKKSNISVTCISPGATDTEFPHRAEVGDKALKTAEKLQMQPVEVARIAVKQMFAGKTEVITGLVNKLGAFMVWLLPKTITENAAASIYK